MLSVTIEFIILSVIMLSVVMLNVVAPFRQCMLQTDRRRKISKTEFDSYLHVRNIHIHKCLPVFVYLFDYHWQTHVHIYVLVKIYIFYMYRRVYITLYN
jgi:hypothetical protein